MSDMMETTPAQEAWSKASRTIGNENMLGIGGWVKAYVDERLAHDAKQSQPAEPRAEGDVPEFGLTVDQWLGKTIDAWPAIESELTSRVAEATAESAKKLGEAAVALFRSQQELADKDRRIAELEKDRDNYKRLFDDAIDAVDEVFQTRSDRDPPILPDFCPLGTSKFRAVVKLAKEYKNLKKQLAERDATIERQRADNAEQGQAVAEVANMHGWNGCEHSKVLSVHIAEELTELAKLREEVARLTRPVEGVEELVELTCKESFASFDAVSWLSVKSLMANAAKKAIQRERAARVAAEQRAAAAEAERDEWISACKELFDAPHQEHFCVRMNHEETQAMNKIRDLLAAFRAEKGKVQA